MARYTYHETKSRTPVSKEQGDMRCPVCGGLQCLCRPRFFPGMLLTDEDLNRLDRYIIEKNKLHNRFLRGWGVVCGLEVVCHPCGDRVTVKEGYALSPCGDDIVVCRDDTVDVCALIKKCRDRERYQRECDSPVHGDNGCKEVEEDWYLAICYDEKPSRGITPLKGSSEAPCCSRCSCGGSSDCGCSCHEQAYDSMKKTYRSPAKHTPPQCEPTVICEGYRYKVFKAPVKGRNVETGALITRFYQCFNKLLQTFPDNSGFKSVNELHKWGCTLKDSLRELLINYPVHDCQLLQKVERLFPVPDEGEEVDAYGPRISTQLGSVLAEFKRYCVCSALIPPCPEPSEDPCVVLARITVRKSDCQIIRVCNWEGRKFATTFPNLQYWLSWYPLVPEIRKYIAKKCCEPPKKGHENFGSIPNPSDATKHSLLRNKSLSEERGKEISTIAINAFINNPTANNNLILMMAALGFTDKAGEPLLDETELRNPLEFLLLNEVVAPVIKDMIPDELKGMVKTFASGLAAEGGRESDQNKEIDALKYQLKELKEMVKKQQTKMEKLSKKKEKK